MTPDPNPFCRLAWAGLFGSCWECVCYVCVRWVCGWFVPFWGCAGKLSQLLPCVDELVGAQLCGSHPQLYTIVRLQC